MEIWLIDTFRESLAPISMMVSKKTTFKDGRKPRCSRMTDDRAMTVVLLTQSSRANDMGRTAAGLTVHVVVKVTNEVVYLPPVTAS